MDVNTVDDDPELTPVLPRPAARAKPAALVGAGLVAGSGRPVRARSWPGCAVPPVWSCGS